MPSSSSFQVAIQVFGYLATCCFALLLVPQIILNQVRQSTDGLSLSLIILWHLAAVFYLPYLLLLKEPLPLLLQWILFTVASVIIELQFFAFQEAEKAAVEEETLSERREELAATAAAAPSSSQLQEGNGKHNGVDGQQKRKKHLLLLALAVGSTIVSFLFIFGLLYLYRALEPRKGGDGIIKILGSGLSSVFLAAGFLPQLYLMCKSRSSEGLSLGLSALDFCGSSFSIIVLCLEAKMDKVAVDAGGVIPYAVIVGFQVVVISIALFVFPDPQRFAHLGKGSLLDIFGHGHSSEEKEAAAAVAGDGASQAVEKMAVARVAQVEMLEEGKVA